MLKKILAVSTTTINDSISKSEFQELISNLFFHVTAPQNYKKIIKNGFLKRSSIGNKQGLCHERGALLGHNKSGVHYFIKLSSPLDVLQFLRFNFGENNFGENNKKTVFVAVDPKIIPKGFRLTTMKKGKIIKSIIMIQILFIGLMAMGSHDFKKISLENVFLCLTLILAMELHKNLYKSTFLTLDHSSPLKADTFCNNANAWKYLRDIPPSRNFSKGHAYVIEDSPSSQKKTLKFLPKWVNNIKIASFRKKFDEELKLLYKFYTKFQKEVCALKVLAKQNKFDKDMIDTCHKRAAALEAFNEAAKKFLDGDKCSQ